MNAPGRDRRNKLHKQEAILRGESRYARQGSHSAGRVRAKTATQETTNRAHKWHIVSMFASGMGTLNVHAQDGKGMQTFELQKRGCRPKKWQGEKGLGLCVYREQPSSGLCGVGHCRAQQNAQTTQWRGNPKEGANEDEAMAHATHPRHRGDIECAKRSRTTTASPMPTETLNSEVTEMAPKT